jgi:hypothetical protein
MPTRMEINAAVDRIISGEDSDGTGRRVLIAFGQSLPINPTEFAGKVWRARSNDTSITGHTQNGDITIEDKKPPEEKGWSSIKKERVGHYKIWRDSTHCISFQHFWKADITTQSNASDSVEYTLGFDPKDLTLLCCIRITRRLRIRIPLLIVDLEVWSPVKDRDV